jgi:hypothetical protein
VIPVLAAAGLLVTLAAGLRLRARATQPV